MDKTFSTFDIQRVLKMPRGRLKDWMEQGYIVPSIQKAEGVGTRNVFSKLDLYGIALFAHLLKIGLSRATAAYIIKRWIASSQKHPIEAIGLYNWLIFIVTEETGEMEIIFEQSSNLREYIQIMREIFNCKKSGAMDWTDVIIVNFEKIEEQVDGELVRK